MEPCEEEPSWLSFICAVEADKSAAAGRALAALSAPAGSGAGVLDGSKTPRDVGVFRCLTRKDLDAYAAANKKKSAAEALAAIVASDREEGLAKKERTRKRRLAKAAKEAEAAATADPTGEHAAAVAALARANPPRDATGNVRERPVPARSTLLERRSAARLHEPDRAYVLLGPSFPKDAAEAAALRCNAVLQLASAPLPPGFDDGAADGAVVIEDPNLQAGAAEPDLAGVVPRGRPATRVVLPLRHVPHRPVFAPAPPQPIEEDEAEGHDGVLPMVVTVVDSVADYTAARAARAAAAADAALEEERVAATADCTRDVDDDDGVRAAEAAAAMAAEAAETAAAEATADKDANRCVLRPFVVASTRACAARLAPSQRSPHVFLPIHSMLTCASPDRVARTACS